MGKPRRLGRYEIRSVIGRGGMGVVYEGWDTILERRVAVKTFQPGAGADDLRERFHKEVKVSSSLSHPNIVMVYDAGVEEGVPFLAMELVEGRSLQEILASRGRLPREEALGIVYRVASALSHAHKRGIVHRDLKPANILIGSDGQPRIVDFGVAKLLDAQTVVTNAILGTPTHMAPEQIRGGPIDERADVFALGVVTYELLTGARPFLGDATALLHRVMHADPAPPSSIAEDLFPEVDAAVMRALRKRPEERTADTLTFARELEAALAVRTRVDSTGIETDRFDAAALRSLPRPADRPRRRWLAVSLATLAAVGAAGAGGYYFVQSSRQAVVRHADATGTSVVTAPAPEALLPDTVGASAPALRVEKGPQVPQVER